MVKFLRALSVLSLFTLSSALFAQVNEVTLVTSGEGQTENEAVNEALRSAIEQAYGVFVSANTDILNDELVKDEIVTVSSGNIHSYKKLGCVEQANGNKNVSVEATVSVSNLVSFAQSKGASCEFAGAVFGANLKLINLNKTNAEKAIEHLYTSLESVAATMYDYEVEVGQPKADGTIEITAIAKANENYKTFTDMVYNTLKSLSINNVKQFDELGVKYDSTRLIKIRVPSDTDLSISYCNYNSPHFKVKPEDYIYSQLDFRDVGETINWIQTEGCLNFNVYDSYHKEYTFFECKKDMYGNVHYDVEYTRTGLYGFDWVGPEYEACNEVDTGNLIQWAVREYCWDRSGVEKFIIPELSSGDIGFKYRKVFQVPVEELMTISGFTIERKVK